MQTSVPFGSPRRISVKLPLSSIYRTLSALTAENNFLTAAAESLVIPKSFLVTNCWLEKLFSQTGMVLAIRENHEFFYCKDNAKPKTSEGKLLPQIALTKPFCKFTHVICAPAPLHSAKQGLHFFANLACEAKSQRSEAKSAKGERVEKTTTSVCSQVMQKSFSVTNCWVHI